jgi:hypothetical protein
MEVMKAAGDGRDSPLKYTGSIGSLPHPLRAGDGRDSPLKYTMETCVRIPHRFDAGDGRDSPLKYTKPGMREE